MASLFAATKKARFYTAMGNTDSALREIEYAESIIRQHWPAKGKRPFAICCFTVDGPLIYCTDDDIRIDTVNKTIRVIKRIPLFPNTVAGRRKDCAACRKFCKQKIGLLKKKIASSR